MRDLTMENPIRAIREISHDMTGRRKVRLANGREASALDIQGEYLAKARDFVDRRELARRSSSRPSTCGSAASRRSSPTTWPRRPRDRLGHQVEADRALPRQARPAAGPPAGRPARPRLPRHPPRPRALLPPREARRGRPGDQRPRRSSRPSRCRRRPPGPGCAASSSGRRRSAGATSPSTGCTSSSTTRRSAPSCARTRSARTTSGCRRLIDGM